MSDDPNKDEEYTDAELEEENEKIARSGIPAIYIDTWFLTTWRGHMRLTFGERVSKIDTYRSAIVLELADAEKLANHMLEMVGRRKKRDGKRRAPQDVAQPGEE